MKRFLLAVLVALSTVLSGPVPQASAASFTITENGVTIRDGHRDYRQRRDGWRRHHYRNDYRRHHYRDDYRRHYRSGWRHDCRTRTIKTYRHHRLVVRKVRVCR